MQSSIGARWSGLITVLGGILTPLVHSPLLWATVTSAGYTRDLSPSDRAFGLNEFDYGWLQVIPQLCFLVGLLGLGALHRGQLGMLGKVGYVITLVGWLIVLGGNVFEYWIVHGSVVMPPLIAGLFALSGAGWAISNLGTIIFYLGLVPLGFAVLRAGRMTRWARFAPLVLGLAGVGVLALTILSFAFTPDLRIPDDHFVRNIWAVQAWIVASSLAWVLIGFGLWMQPNEPAKQIEGDPGSVTTPDKGSGSIRTG